MKGQVLHVLSQRPSRTGSGVTLEAMVQLAAAAGWAQTAVVGVPAAETRPRVGGLSPDCIHPVTFADDSGLAADLPFAVPGMSDVMPYPSSVWSRLSPEQIARYRQVWRKHLSRVIDLCRPSLIQSNHVWLVSSLLPDLAPDIPLVITCHATGLRQMELCPGLKDEVVTGCRQARHFLVLRQDHRRQLAGLLDIPETRISVVGVGFRDDVFHRKDAPPRQAGSLLFVGKYSQAKGLPWLLDALEGLLKQRPETVLHVAGDGAGPEAEDLRLRMQGLEPAVVRHGQLDQQELAELMRRCQVCVLPSFYEGVPLVLAEAAACGCRIVATELPGVCEQLAPHLGDWLHPVPLPPLLTVDTPEPAGLPAFVRDLESALAEALDRAQVTTLGAENPPQLMDLSWSGVFDRVEDVWLKIRKIQNSH